MLNGWIRCVLLFYFVKTLNKFVGVDRVLRCVKQCLAVTHISLLLMLLLLQSMMQSSEHAPNAKLAYTSYEDIVTAIPNCHTMAIHAPDCTEVNIQPTIEACYHFYYVLNVGINIAG
jgi:hypothetical protein